MQAPDDGLRAWVEIGGAGALPGMRQFMTVPYQGITYRFGAERAIAMHGGTLLLTGEAADLEQPTDIRGQATQDFYTSSDIPQGWTQRGQILGDGIGPGGQSQWFAVDWVTPKPFDGRVHRTGAVERRRIPAPVSAVPEPARRHVQGRACAAERVSQGRTCTSS